MSDEMFIEGKSYLSSRRAAQLTGYAQDYIGQLSRKGLIDAQRIGGLWYVEMESLEGYKQKASAFKPEPPIVRERKKDPSTLVFFDGKEYVSAAHAAEMTGYVQDYVGQLARLGHILARQVGNRWYIEKESLLRHKQEKDGLLAAVQTQSVGLQHLQKDNVENVSPEEPEKVAETASYTYLPDTADLLPVIKRTDSRDDHKISDDSVESKVMSQNITSIPIRRPAVQKTPTESSPNSYSKGTFANPKQQVQLLPLAIGTAATIVIVLSVGYASVLKQNSVYAAAPMHVSSAQNLAASVGGACNKIGDVLEPLVTHELVYRRADAQ